MNIETKKLGTILFALPFIVSGLFHFVNARGMAMAITGFPMAEFLIYFSGLTLIAGALAIITNTYVRLASLLLALELFLITISVQLPGLMNPESMQDSMIGLLHNISLIGGALLIHNISPKVKAIK
ncbi:DoxX family membrane protein [Ancylomarina sp. YFZ004]